MARYKIKKKRSDLKTDVFVEATEDWVKHLKAWALPITLGAAALGLVVVFWTWSSRAEAERLDKLWARLGALVQETVWNDDTAAKWELLLADTAGTDVEPHALLRYAGRLIGEVKTEQLRKAGELLQRVETSDRLTPDLVAAAAGARKQLDALLGFKPGGAGAAEPEPGKDKETSSSTKSSSNPSTTGGGAAAPSAAAAAASAGGDEAIQPPQDGAAKAGNVKDSASAEAAASSGEAVVTPAATAAPAAGAAAASGASAGAAAPGPATNQLPVTAEKKKQADEEREAVRKRQKPPP